MKNQTNQSTIEWREVLLEEICKIVSGSTPSTSNPEYWDGTINWVTPAELIDGNNWYYYKTQRKISDKGLKSCSSELFPKGTVMLTSRAPIGKVAIAGTEMCSNQGFKNLICDTKQINPEYLYHWLRSKKEFLNSLGHGATFKEISKKIVSKIKILLPFRNGHPDLETQKAIVSILEKAEQLKEKRKQSLKLLDEYVKSTFNEMFVGKGFEEKKLNQIAEIVRDSINPSKIKDYQYYIGLEHIESETGRVIDKIETKAIDLKSTKFLFDEDCILYGKLRPYLNKIAIPNFKGVCSTDIIPIREIKNISNKYYLAFLLRQKDYVNNATSLSIGANLPRLSPRSLESFKIPLPPLPLQQTFASLVEHVEKLKGKQNQSLKEIEQLFNALMQKAFNGELV